MKANEYAVLTRAIEEGIAYGWMRAHKHTATPTEETVKEEIERAVTNHICEVFHFEPIPPELES